MAIFRTKHTCQNANIPTAALPDIIFMLLFFFMVTTVLKKNEDQLKYMIPQAVQLRQIEQKTLVTKVKVGLPRDMKALGNQPRIEANGKIIHQDDLVAFILAEKEKLPVYSRDQIIILLKADQDVPMGIITDVQQSLRKANARKIVYAATWKQEY